LRAALLGAGVRFAFNVSLFGPSFIGGPAKTNYATEVLCMTLQNQKADARDVLAIVEASLVFGPLVKKQPELLTLLLRAADGARTEAERSRFFEALSRATMSSDKRLEVFLQGDAAEFEKWSRISLSASEDLGRVLKELCPSWDAPIGESVSSPLN